MTTTNWNRWIIYQGTYSEILQKVRTDLNDTNFNFNYVDATITDTTNIKLYILDIRDITNIRIYTGFNDSNINVIRDIYLTDIKQHQNLFFNISENLSFSIPFAVPFFIKFNNIYLNIKNVFIVIDRIGQNTQASLLDEESKVIFDLALQSFGDYGIGIRI